MVLEGARQKGIERRIPSTAGTVGVIGKFSRSRNLTRVTSGFARFNRSAARASHTPDASLPAASLESLAPDPAFSNLLRERQHQFPQRGSIPDRYSRVSARCSQLRARDGTSCAERPAAPSLPSALSSRPPVQTSEPFPTSSVASALFPEIARRRWRASFCRVASRRDSSRRCCNTCWGWFAPQRSGSSGSRSVSPALTCSSSSGGHARQRQIGPPVRATSGEATACKFRCSVRDKLGHFVWR